MIRKFWLTNSKDEKYELTDKNSKIFLLNPSGLGFKKGITLSRFGNEVNVEEITYAMPEPQGELLFHKNSLSGKYQDYQDFLQFAKKRPLKLYYQTPNTFDSWYIDCEILQLEKSEVANDGLMHCAIVFAGTSFWKTTKEYEVVVEEQLVGGKIYPYTYPFEYEGNSFAHIELQSNGTMETGFRFEINDEVQNATLSLYQDDEKYGEIKILGTYDKIKVDTRDNHESIYLEYNGSAIANPTSKFDLSSNGEYQTPFPKLRVGDNVLTFSYGGVFTKSIHIKWQDLFSSI